jgi:integrase
MRDPVQRRWEVVLRGDGHPHMSRDTFAVRKHAVSLETVSMLLGHASIKVTEKH